MTVRKYSLRDGSLNSTTDYNVKDIIRIITDLANGIDPTTKNAFHTDNPCNHPDIIRALFMAAKILDTIEYSTTKKRPQLKSFHTPTDNTTPLTEREKIIYDKLVSWRTKKASTDDVPAYVVAHNKQLLEIIKMRVSTREELSNIKGFGERKIDKYGNEIIEIMKSD